MNMLFNVLYVSLQRQSQMLQAHGVLAQKKDIVFPPDSVEAAQPNLVKRRKMVSKDLGKALAQCM